LHGWAIPAGAVPVAIPAAAEKPKANAEDNHDWMD